MLSVVKSDLGSKHGETTEEDYSDELREEVEEINNVPNPLLYFHFGKLQTNPLFNRTFVDKYGNQIKSNFVLKNKEVIALYFSSSPCVKCPCFLPHLKEIHKKAEQYKKRFEIVYVSCDRSKEDMMAYFRAKHGNWFGIEYEDPIRQGLRYDYELLAIPQLIVVNSKGGTITRTGLAEIEEFGVNVLVTWF